MYKEKYMSNRGAIASAIRGKRGQAFLKEMLEAMDALPEKKLIAYEFINCYGQVCALGSVMIRRHGFGTFKETAASYLGISRALVEEIIHINNSCKDESDEDRFVRVRRWTNRNIERITHDYD
jgi:hypothetical protein